MRLEPRELFLSFAPWILGLFIRRTYTNLESQRQTAGSIVTKNAPFLRHHMSQHP